MNNTVKRTLIIFTILFILLGASVVATKSNVKAVKVNFPDGSVISLATSKDNVLEILEDNNITLLENEEISGSLNLNDNNTINIINKSQKIVGIETLPKVELSEISKNYEDSIEKIIYEEIEIPYETVTTTVEGYTEENGQNRVVQEGENGIKRIKYVALYRNEILLEKNQVEEEILKEPKEKVVQLRPNIQTRASVPTVNVPVGDARTAFDKVASEKGLSENQKNGWAYIIQRESGWRTTATNASSGAYGLPQSLPGNKMASHGSDWATNPETQLYWMYDYMTGRYGSIQGALDFWNANSWY